MLPLIPHVYILVLLDGNMMVFSSVSPAVQMVTSVRLYQPTISACRHVQMLLVTQVQETVPFHVLSLHMRIPIQKCA